MLAQSSRSSSTGAYGCIHNNERRASARRGHSRTARPVSSRRFPFERVRRGLQQRNRTGLALYARIQHNRRVRARYHTPRSRSPAMFGIGKIALLGAAAAWFRLDIGFIYESVRCASFTPGCALRELASYDPMKDSMGATRDYRCTRSEFDAVAERCARQGIFSKVATNRE
jgi:hypothetical protein